MPYINRYSYKKQNDIETVDQFDTRAEAIKMLAEYRLADPSAHYAISQRATKDWYEDKKAAEVTAILYQKGYLEMD